MFLLKVLLLLTVVPNLYYTWSDGSPCSRHQMLSMNPAEAPEHEGGLQLTEPPYEIVVSSRCYWRNTPIVVTLKGKTNKLKFKGFQLQAHVFNGPEKGTAKGSFVRLDDNGSWQLQCFKSNTSATHSHHEKKSELKLWWKSEREDTETIQFVATVVESIKVFWVQSVLSVPIPPCKVEREFGPWSPQPITAPPQPDQFKIETSNIFRTGRTNLQKLALQKDIRDDRISTQNTKVPGRLPSSVSPEQDFKQVATTTRRGMVRDGNIQPRLNNFVSNQVVTAAPISMNRQQANTVGTSREANTFATRQQQPNPSINRQPNINMQPNINRQQPTTFVVRAQTQAPNSNFVTRPPQQRQTMSRNVNRSMGMSRQRTGTTVCMDRASPQRCFSWARFCFTSPTIRQACNRTCRVCQ